MEALLLGDDSDDDSDVEEVPKPPAPEAAGAGAAPPVAPPASAPAPVSHPPAAAAPAPITTAPPATPATAPATAAASTPAPPAHHATAPNAPLAGPAAGSPANISNSVLTNRLKSLYNSPPIGAPSKAKAPAAPVAAGKPGGPPTQPPPQQRGGGYPPGPAAPSNRSSYGAPPPGSGYPPGAAPSPRMPQPQPQQPAPATTAGGAPAPRAMPQPKPIGGGVSVGRVPAPLPKARTTQRSAPPSARVAAVPGRGGMHPSSMAGGAPSQPTPQQQHPQQQHQQHQPPPHGQPPLGSESYEPTPLSAIVGRSGSAASSSSGYTQPPNAVMHVNQYPPPPGQRVGHPHQQPARPGAGHAPQPLQPNNPARAAMSGGGLNAGPGHPHNPHGLHGVHKGVSHGGGVSLAGNSSAGTSMSQTELEKKRKEQFLMFTRVLMKYLEQRDKEVHTRAKTQIKECYEKNKAGDPNFASLTISMKSTLRAVVGEVYWKKAEDYLQHFLQSKKGQLKEKEMMKRQQQQQQLPPTHPQQQPQQPQQQPQQHPQHPQQQLPQQQQPQQHPQQPPQQPPQQRVQQAQYMTSGVVHQQPGGPTVVGRPTTSSQSGVMAPPPTGRSSVPPPLQPSGSSGVHLTQTQAAAAKKMPLSSIPKSGAPAVASTPPPNPLAPAAPPPVLTAEEAKKQKEEEAKKKKEAQRLKRNADSKARRDRKKKEKEEERKKAVREKKLGGAVHAAAAAAVSAPVQPSTAGPGVVAPAIVAGQYAPATSATGITAAGSAGTTSSAVSAGSRVTATSTAPSTTPTTTSETKKKKVKKKKKKVVKAKSSALSGTKKKSTTTSEYHELMEMVDHAVMIDVKSLPTLLPKDHKSNINLEEEQRLLLYGDDGQSEKVKEIALAAAYALESNSLDNPITETDEGENVSPLPWKLPAYYTGWGQSNVVSIRTAWAKVRLPEREMQMAEKEQQEAEKSLRERPMLVSSTENVEGTTKDGPEGLKSSKAEEVDPVDADATNHVWYNESRAEQDPALAMISEATELYLKAIIEKAIGKARLRQNLDGVRLWHTLCSYQSDPNSNKGKPPPALIRLGCDVRRQVALAQGNAAKTYQRMEEAISRRNDTYHSRTPTDPNEMVLEATSMSDLSKMPPLKSAVQDADLEAKRKFEIFGGKDSQEPPLGRVPKKAKVLIQDMSIGALGKHAPLMKPPARRRVMPGMFRR